MPWKVEWLVDRSRNPLSIPAYRFLKAIPVNVRIQLLAILEAVLTTGPDQWTDRRSHCPMKGVRGYRCPRSNCREGPATLRIRR